jgi:hypothetical protein
MILRVLPVGYVQNSVGTTGYYYYDGVYFRPTTDGTYAVVAPPVGAIVPQPPNGADAIVLGSATYYYGGGAFYLQQLTGFAVVETPLGITLADLPHRAEPVVIDGVIYYVAGLHLARRAAGARRFTLQRRRSTTGQLEEPLGH